MDSNRCAVVVHSRLALFEQAPRGKRQPSRGWARTATATIGLWCLFLAIPSSWGQITNVTADQATPTPGVGHDYIRMLSETVNPADGSLSVRIAVPMPPGRQLTVPFAFAYDSNGSLHLIANNGNYEGLWTSNTSYLAQNGWSYSAPSLEDQVSELPGFTKGVCAYSTAYVFQDASGDRHALDLGVNELPSTNQNCGGYISHTLGGDPVVQAGTTAPGSLPPVTVADADGTAYYFSNPAAHEVSTSPNYEYATLANFVEDRNGNRLTVTDSGNGVFTYGDTAGRTVISSSGFGAAGNTVAVSGLENRYTLTWEPTSFSFPPPHYTIVFQGSSYCYINPIPGDSSSGSTVVVTALALPNGQQYAFSYDSTYGLVNEIKYPTGGYVSYSWGVDPQSYFISLSDTQGTANACQYIYDSFAVLHRYVSFNGSTIALQQDFSYSTSWNGDSWTTKTTTVKTTDLTRTPNVISYQVYTYTPVSVAIYPYEPYYVAPQAPVESSIVYEDSSQNVLRTVNKSWLNQYEMSCQSTTQGAQTSRIDYSYGSGAQIADKKEWDWGAPACGSSDSATPLRETMIAYQSLGDTLTYTYGPSIFDRPSTVTVNGNGTEAAQTKYVYDNPPVTAPGEGEILFGRDTAYNNNQSVARGNLTTKTEVLLSGTSPVTNYANDDTGQRLSLKDANGNTTTYNYADSYASGTPPGKTNAYLTNITYPNTGIAHVESFKYNYADGQLASSTDENTQTTSYLYESGGLDRLDGINYPDCGATCSSGTHSVSYAYNDTPPTPSVTTTKLANPDPNVVSEAVMDGVGQVTKTVTTSVTPNIETDTAYDGENRVYTVSNPYYVNSQSPSDGTSTYTYDALGRTTNVNHADNNNTTTAYSANCATVTDPATKARESCTDGLGRLTTVYEDPGSSPHLNYTTTYSYDALDNLTGVTQGSSQTSCGGISRQFTYDLLSRLTSACNPESGTVSYSQYDGNGNPLTRKDARGITTNYTYDQLNRLRSKSYTGDPTSTPAASFFYDSNWAGIDTWRINSLTNTVGRLMASCTSPTPLNCSSSSTATIYSYDAMGRPTSYWQCTPYNCASSPWGMTYTYDLGGNVTSWAHPSGGFTISNQIDAAGRITQISQSPSDNSNYPSQVAQSITYNPFGKASVIVDGCAGSPCTNLREAFTYNNRLQPVVLQLGWTGSDQAYYCQVYNYYSATPPSTCAAPTPGTAGNNGSITSYLYLEGPNGNASLSHTAVFAYDSVNRLTNATANWYPNGALAYNLPYTVGQYGNISCVQNSQTQGPCAPLTFNVGNNQITGYTYDESGDVVTDGLSLYGYTWDAEGRLVNVVSQGSSIFKAQYNAPGQRAEFTTSAYQAEQAFDPSGGFLGQYNATGGFWWEQDIRFQGRILAYNLGLTHTVFLHKDVLGSSHMATGPSGSWLQDQLFYPWGQSWKSLGTWQEQGFAGFDVVDTATSLYPTQARMYDSAPGRWLTPDPDNAGSDPSDPETWNAYAYVRNNPTTLTDPDGTDYNVCTNDQSGSQTCTRVTNDVAFEQALNNPGAGITVQQGNGSGTFSTTDPNTGQQVQAGTYQWEPPTPQEEGTVDATNNVINGALLLTGVGRLATGAVSLGEGLFNSVRSFVADEGLSAVGAEVGAGASAYPAEIAGYKVSQHVFDRMAEDLGHRVPSQAVEQTIKYGMTMSGKTADMVVKYLPTANVRGVTVAIKQSTREIIMVRVGQP